VLKSYKERLRARLPVAVAELGDVENYQTAAVGICCVSGDLRQAEDVIEKALGMAGVLSDAILADTRHEVIPFGELGNDLRGGIDAALDQALTDKLGES
jgi:uncharacterized protein YlxP (DUF503 family)